MKKSPLKKKSKASISQIQRKLWELCKTIIREKYPNVCYTCGRTGLAGSNWHTGHMIPKASLGAFLKYDLRILRPQCYNCNINLGGNGAEFYRRMMIEVGSTRLHDILEDRKVSVQAKEWYEKLINDYTEIIYQSSGYAGTK